MKENRYESYYDEKIEALVAKIGVKDDKEFADRYPSLLELQSFPYAAQYHFYLETGNWMVGLVRYHPVEALSIFRFYFKEGEVAQINPYAIFREALAIETVLFEKLYGLVELIPFARQDTWKEAYFSLLPDAKRTKAKREKVLQFYRGLASPVTWPSILVEKFSARDADFPGTLLRILTTRKEEDPDFRYELSNNFFNHHSSLLETDFPLAKQAYFQTVIDEPSFDVDKTQLVLFFRKQPSFLEEYIALKFPEFGFHREASLQGFEKLWQTDHPEEAIKKALLFLARRKLFSLSDHLGCMFFKQLTGKETVRAITFLKTFLASFSTNPKIVNMVLDIGRNALPYHYHELILHFLEHNSSLEIFTKLDLYNNHFSSSGRTSWDEFKAGVLSKISDAIKGHQKTFHYTPHLIFLENKIIQYLARGEKERKGWFMGWN